MLTNEQIQIVDAINQIMSDGKERTFAEIKALCPMPIAPSQLRMCKDIEAVDERVIEKTATRKVKTYAYANSNGKLTEKEAVLLQNAQQMEGFFTLRQLEAKSNQTFGSALFTSLVKKGCLTKGEEVPQEYPAHSKVKVYRAIQKQFCAVADLMVITIC